MNECDEHIECIQEKISDYRHVEDIGLIFISLGLTSLSLMTTIFAQGVALFLIVFGAFLFVFGGWKKGKTEAKLCNLLKSRKL